MNGDGKSNPMNPNSSRAWSTVKKPCVVESAKREVIENKLLTALEDEGVVAALLNKEDLKEMISALRLSGGPRAKQLAQDMQQLHDAAFKQ